MMMFLDDIVKLLIFKTDAGYTCMTLLELTSSFTVSIYTDVVAVATVLAHILGTNHFEVL